jgi:hypothetical protein
MEYIVGPGAAAGHRPGKYRESQATNAAQDDLQWLRHGEFKIEADVIEQHEKAGQ